MSKNNNKNKNKGEEDRRRQVTEEEEDWVQEEEEEEEERDSCSDDDDRPGVTNGGGEWLETRVRVSGVPVHARQEELDQVLESVGVVEKCEKYASRDGHTQVVHVTYESLEAAREAAQRLNGISLEGGILRVDRLMDRRRSPRGAAGGGPMGGGHMGGPGAASPSQRHTDFPLRILVLSEMVGAIIGRQGATIRTITQQTRARVDVHRKDNAGSLEKAITIYGNPENCTNACKRILEVMQEEADNTNKGVVSAEDDDDADDQPLCSTSLDREVPLKILAHNNLIGRIIGKGGTTIKKIMDDTSTKITVSSINDINSFNLERIITIKGSIEDIAMAENMISARLRSSYESDLQAFAPQSAMFPGLHPMAMMSTVGFGLPRGSGGGAAGAGAGAGMGMYGSSPTSYPPLYPTPIPGQQGYHGSEAAEEIAYLYIPNSAVGAIIGTKGSHIRNIIRFSGASVKIAPLEDEGRPTEQSERKVTIVGSPEAQWKAQFLIFEKIREEGYGVGVEDVRLTVEIVVPSTQVGRIIGKGGQNVRDLQRQTGSVIKLPQQGSTTSEDTTVHIVGPFFSVQSAQRRIRAIIQMSTSPSTSGGVGGGTSTGTGSSGRPSRGPLTPRMHQ
ncbi:insulin-like growth factor 2 mRNA-binding protein 1 isoform X2 [Eriocheir sinensis]|uniref:insulin-like growth factor 2 mRNA-binding protein 1 isoform X2 n=1 Tax=Eriocheir sinensis TaxID=95602 RepID=UPI0021CA00BF|nr:insulin-like growth factor 2 mRNA-binding protein 1 isoform X2 [Eriocheir sinensis]